MGELFFFSLDLNKSLMFYFLTVHDQGCVLGVHLWI